RRRLEVSVVEPRCQRRVPLSRGQRERKRRRPAANKGRTTVRRLETFARPLRAVHSGAGLTRRQLLRLGVGSVGVLGLPLLSPERSSAAADAPQRLLLVFTPNGTVPNSYWPAAGLSETDFVLNEIMKP